MDAVLPSSHDLQLAKSFLRVEGTRGNKYVTTLQLRQRLGVVMMRKSALRVVSQEKKIKEREAREKEAAINEPVSLRATLSEPPAHASDLPRKEDVDTKDDDADIGHGSDVESTEIVDSDYMTDVVPIDFVAHESISPETGKQESDMESPMVVIANFSIVTILCFVVGISNFMLPCL